MFKIFVKSKLLFIAFSIFSCQVLIAAENPLDVMMKAGADAAQQTMDAATEAVDKARNDAKAAVAKLPSYPINILELKQEPEEPSLDFQWSKETIKLANEGDVALGEELAEKGKCSKCHGETGVSEDDDTPSIAGQITAYSFKQLHDYKVGLRENKQMRKKVKNMSPKDMADVSAYYATQKREKKHGVKIPVLVATGDVERFLLACNSCHNDDSMKRGYQTPILEGQKIEYFKETMLAFKESDRENDHYKLMRAIAEKLTEDEIDLLAEYYSAKPSDDD